MSEQYWCQPKKAKAERGEAWWYAESKGRIEIYSDYGPSVFIRASALRKFIDMLDKKKAKP